MNDIRLVVPTPIEEAIRSALTRIQFGHVQIIIHNGQVVQVDETSRHRFVSVKPEANNVRAS
jgi:hypothetical protein